MRTVATTIRRWPGEVCNATASRSRLAASAQCRSSTSQSTNRSDESRSTEDSDVRDPWVTRMRNLPTTVVSTTLERPLDWPNATLVSGDAIDVVARLKQESDVPLRSHGSLSLNRALMAAGLVDGVKVTLYSRSSPVRPGRTRSSRVRPTLTWS